MKILIAEDERITRTSLARQLQKWGHEVVETEDGVQAWETFAASEFDIVISDWEMPHLSGVEFVRKIRAAHRDTYTYVILLTSRSDKADIVNGIEAGADDYVPKPFDRDELRVRLLAGERIVRLERTLSEQNARLREASERIHHGLDAAARVQRSMLPQHNIVTPRVATAWNYVPTDELAGDGIGLHLIEDRYLVAYVLDVSGHGVPAALLSVSAMRLLEPLPPETSLLRNSSNNGSGPVRPPSQVAAELNRRFRAGENDGRFLTMLLCVLDTFTGRLHVTSAGHPPPIILRDTEDVELSGAGGLPIAVLDSSEYEEDCCQLRPGDRVCLYSDGILEQASALSDEQFGRSRLCQSIGHGKAASLDNMVISVVQDLRDWAGGQGFVDDVSIVAIEWRGRRATTT